MKLRFIFVFCAILCFLSAANGQNYSCTIDGSTLRISGSGSISASNSYKWNSYRDATTKVVVEGVRNIPRGAFMGWTSLNSVSLGSSVTSIDRLAFCGCTSLTTVVFSEGLSEIDSHAFSGCDHLGSIVLPLSLSRIGIRAFSECTNLRSVKAKGSNFIVDNLAFIGCDNFRNIDRDYHEAVAKEVPKIDWLDFSVSTEKTDYPIRLGIKSKSKIEEINISVNGNITRGIITSPRDGYDMTVEKTLALSEGTNTIKISVRNADGISTSEKMVNCKPVIHAPVYNDRRIALIIGNSHYSYSESNLANPGNDATDVANKLKTLGFKVMLKLDATQEDMDKLLTAFSENAKNYDVALFYYAGHGIQSKGVNYILPVNINGLAEDNLKYKCVDMEHVLDVMENSNCKLKIVILDACRDNPLTRSWHRGVGTRGLNNMNAPEGTIISFSTAAGKTANDGVGQRNSPYTRAFLKTLDIPNMGILNFFKNVGAEVMRETKRAQNPWMSSSSFIGDFYFNNQ